MPRPDAPDRAPPPPNRLLAALPDTEFEVLRPRLEPVGLALRDVLFEVGQAVSHAYFPTEGVVSLLCPPEGRGLGVEVGVVGREGMAGLSLFLGADVTPFRCLVQVPGGALRLRADDLRRVVVPHTRLYALLLRYTHAFVAQLSQATSCNAVHPVEKRLCRWLLAVHDRVDGERFPLTHEFLAAMLGVRRASVTDAARGLRQAGLIRYGGGQLTVLDRPGLEATACGCHRAMRAELDRLPV
jgi:CRP-like cAMP-binding protein